MTAKEIVQTMVENDAFSRWLGIEVLAIGNGSCSLKMRLRREMLNGFGIAHGGIAYSFADSALAFASNSKGQKSLSVETSISHTKSLNEGDEIFADAICETETGKMGFYKVTVRRGKDETVALFRGIVYKTAKNWERDPA